MFLIKLKYFCKTIKIYHFSSFDKVKKLYSVSGSLMSFTSATSENCLEILLKYDNVRKLLLEQSNDLTTPIFIAVNNENIDAVRTILSYSEGRQSLLIRNLDSEVTVLHFYDNECDYTDGKFKECISDILKEIFKCEEYHQIINVQEKERKETPLHISIDYDNGNILKMLLDYGADYTIKNDEYETPYGKVRESGSKTCRRILRQFIKDQKVLIIKEPDC